MARYKGWVAWYKEWEATLEGWEATLEEWVAKLVAHLLVTLLFHGDVDILVNLCMGSIKLMVIVATQKMQYNVPFFHTAFLFLCPNEIFNKQMAKNFVIVLIVQTDY